MKCAVILAAGKANLPFPAALTKIDNEILIERTVQLLLNQSFTKIFIVIGYESHKFNFLKKYKEVKLIYNPEYFFTGTMNSLSKVYPYIESDFLLIEGDLYFDQVVVDLILQNKEPNSIITANLSDSLDECILQEKSAEECKRKYTSLPAFQSLLLFLTRKCVRDSKTITCKIHNMSVMDNSIYQCSS